jgi:tetratricopeptide (TPR) repeat protein
VKNRAAQIVVLAVLLTGSFLILPGSGQYREYYVFGKVLDTQKNPLEGVEITVRDVLSNRRFTIKTKKDGEFKFAGLPHATYKVEFKKDGYATKEDEWKLATPQEAMQKVEIPPVLLATQAQVEEAGRLKEMEGEVKEAFGKIAQKDFDGGIAILKEVLAKNPRDANALFLIGYSYSKKQMSEEAVGALTQVIELAPNFAQAHFELAVCYQNQGEKEKALEQYRRTLDLDANNPDAAYNSGLILFGLGRADEALADFERALQAKPGVPEYLEMAGRCFINQGNFPKAIEYLEQAKAVLSDPEKIKFLEDLIGKLKEQIKQEPR